MIQILIQDEQLNGTITNQFELSFDSEITTTRAIIELRVKQEVERYNEKKNSAFNGLVQPKLQEIILNARTPKQQPKVDAEQQIYIALDAFQKNGYFILVNNQQLEDLDELITLTPQTTISFIKLTPLVGG